MKRILVYGMTDNPGGIETYLLNLAERLESKVCFDYITDFPDIAYREKIEQSESLVYFIPAKGKRLFSHWAAFYRTLKAHPEYDTVYFNVLDAGAAVTQLIPRLLGRKIITHSHNSGTDKPRLHKICKPLLNRLSDVKIACSGLAAEYMFGTKAGVTVIPNAIDTEKFRFNAQLREEKRKEFCLSDKTVICHIGRLSYQKNPLGMLDIFKETLKKEPSAVLMSVGTGEEEERVHAYAGEIGVAENVLFLGKRADIPALLMAADVFFLPSFYEGLPIVAIEAQAAGLYCVLSDSITAETDLTGQVEFLSLDDDFGKWADSLIMSAGYERADSTDKIISAGYDLKNSQKNDDILLKILERNGLNEKSR